MTPLLAALVAVDLVRPVAQATAPLRKVAIQDDGEPSFRRDLRAYLEKRSRALTFVELAQGANVLTAIENERPFLFITNGPRESLHRTARAVRALPFVRGMTMATMVDGGTEEDIRALMASGFNVVLRKPVHVTDLEGLLLEAQASLSSLEAELNVRSVTSLSASIPPPHRAGRTG
jgi:DNA-binding NarL/FixJ family response regulator